MPPSSNCVHEGGDCVIHWDPKAAPLASMKKDSPTLHMRTKIGSRRAAGDGIECMQADVPRSSLSARLTREASSRLKKWFYFDFPLENLNLFPPLSSLCASDATWSRRMESERTPNKAANSALNAIEFMHHHELWSDIEWGEMRSARGGGYEGF